jgi:hypothetical protein
MTIVKDGSGNYVPPQTLAATYKIKWCHNPEDHEPHGQETSDVVILENDNGPPYVCR